MRWEAVIGSPESNLTNWMMEDSLKSTIWTPVENKLFEDALAKFDEDTPDRWRRVAEMVPGKTVVDVLRQYKELEDDVSSIEAGFYPKYSYNGGNSSFTLEWGNSNGVATPCQGKRSAAVSVVAAGRPVEQERKKGVPWTEEEHKMFLLGLKKYGKGDWRNISRNFVVTRTPTQVASHAQKYFIRQLSGGKDKRRASIHDITTVNVNESHVPSLENKRNPSSEQCKWDHANGQTTVVNFNQTHGNVVVSTRYGGNSFGGGGGLHESYGGPQSMVFPMQPAMHYPQG